MTTTATGVELTGEQAAALNRLRAGVETWPVQTLGGYAGVGKTVIAERLVRALPEFAVVAFTGKAADVLRRKGVEDASTIHSRIYRPIENGGKVEFVLKSLPEVGCSGFIIDEASMVGLDEWRNLKSFGLPIIAIGDHGQLPPVGGDAKLMHKPNVTLEQIHRNAGPISYFAEHLRLDKPAVDWKAPLLKEKEVWVVRDRENIGDRSLLAADQIICAYNRTRVSLNRHIRKLQDRDANNPQVGDKVICLQNSRDYGVFNGMQGRIVEIDRGAGRLAFQPTYGDCPIELPYDPLAFNSLAKKGEQDKRGPSDPIPFDYAYCVTCHKAQGDQWHDVLVFEEKCDLWEHKRWAYTAASRAMKRLVWVCG